MVSDVYFPRVNGVSTSINTYRTDLLALGRECTPRDALAHHPVSMLRRTMPTISAAPGDAGAARPRRVRLFRFGEIERWAGRLRPEEASTSYACRRQFAAHYAGIKIARRLGVPVVESYHTYFEHYLQHYVPVLPAFVTRGLARRFSVSRCAQVQAIISPSRQMADALRAYGVQTLIEVLPTGLPADTAIALVTAHGSGLRTASVSTDRSRCSSVEWRTKKTSTFCYTC
jgi:glycosyltransferase involved in cell wall biosynthesis